jgi:hypothetical protein
MMCDRRYCGCVLRGRNLIRLAAAAFAALAMAGAAATVLQDLLDALLIGLPVLVAGMAVGFVLQVRSFRKQTIRSRAAPVTSAPRPGPAPVTPAPRPAQAIQPPPRLVLDATPLDISALDATPLDATALDATALDISALDATALDATPLDATALDATPLDASALDASALDASPTVAAAALIGERDAARG